MLVERRYTFKCYPNTQQIDLLDNKLEACRLLYNELLAIWRDAYTQSGKVLTFFDLCKEVTKLRKDNPIYKKIYSQICQMIARRVAQAGGQYIIRKLELAQQKKAAGLPRFKNEGRMRNLAFKQYGFGFEIHSSGKNGSITVHGIGKIKMRGQARTWGEARTLEIIKQADSWYASIVILCSPDRISGTKKVGIDWGVKTFAVIADKRGDFIEIANPRFHKQAEDELAAAYRDLSRKKKKSKNWERAHLTVEKKSIKLANRRKDFSHKASAKIINFSSLVAIETFAIPQLLAFHHVPKKSLNKSILDAAPSLFVNNLRYKAEEAGIVFTEVPALDVRPTQTCSGCGAHDHKILGKRTHGCSKCGLSLSRDQNSARVILNWALSNRLAGGNHPRVEGTSFPLKHKIHAINIV